jgi:hypothetical protein
MQPPVSPGQPETVSFIGGCVGEVLAQPMVELPEI